MSQPHSRSLGLVPADNKLPFLTYLSPSAGKRARWGGRRSRAENSSSGANTLGVVFSFLASPVMFLEDLGAGLALLAPIGRPPQSLITSACLTKSPTCPVRFPVLLPQSSQFKTRGGKSLIPVMTVQPVPQEFIKKRIFPKRGHRTQ